MKKPVGKRNLHVLICNERLLFRFGVDRILVETAKMLVDEGHRVTCMCLRCEKDVVSSITPHIYVPEIPEGLNLYDTEKHCEAYLLNQWATICAEQPVDAIICGGWPFFHTSRLGKRLHVPSIFIDAGAVPHDGLHDPQLSVQRAVRRVRAATLPHFDVVWPISRFINQSQTLPERGRADGVEVIPLGVDHLAGHVFGEGAGKFSATEAKLFQKLNRLLSRHATLILNLGRFESFGYKNSAASFDLLRTLMRRALDLDQGEVYLLLLAKDGDVVVPADIEGRVIFLGTPGDAALQTIMTMATVGFSPSLWEGFNLPIGEMQILHKPVFAFNIGAHPEVIVHPWFLCSSIDEAACKISDVLTKQLPAGVISEDATRDYRERFSWANTLEAYRSRIVDIAERYTTATTQDLRPLLFIDVSNSSRDTANTGVVRVTRRLSAALLRLDQFHIFFVYWNFERQSYSFVDGARHGLLANFSGPETGFDFLTNPDLGPEQLLGHLPSRASVPATLFLPEVIMDEQAGNRLQWAKRFGLATVGFLHDLIPIDYPELCSTELCRQFPSYVHALAHTDHVIANSRYSQDRFLDYAAEQMLPLPPVVEALWLPGQLGAVPRMHRPPTAEAAGGEISIVCVSTIERRKNHVTLLNAYAKVRARRPHLRLRLTLIGNCYAGAEDLAEVVRAAEAKDPSIAWLGAVSDETLLSTLNGAAFTVYPSLVEGFGLPVLESLWVGKPCICNSSGVMAELAAGGGCLTADMEDADALAMAIERLAASPTLRDQLTEDACQREISDWAHYGAQFARRLLPPDRAHGIEMHPAAERTATRRYRDQVVRMSRPLRHRINGVALLRNRLDPVPPIAEPSPAAVEQAPPAEVKWEAEGAAVNEHVVPTVVATASVPLRKRGRTGLLAMLFGRGA